MARIAQIKGLVSTIRGIREIRALARYMKFKELTTKSRAELEKTVEELRHEAHTLKMKISLGEAKTSHKLKEIRKDIARILTHLGS